MTNPPVMGPAAAGFTVPADAGLPPLNPAPRWTAVLREQIGSVRLALRQERVFLEGIALFLTVYVVWEQARENGLGVLLNVKAGIAPAVVALMVPLALWKDEDPAHRAYHHAMPVGHAAHAAARSAAGLVWTLAGVAAFFAWLGLLSYATGGWAEDFERWQWAAPFAGATVLYLLGSALALAAAHPWRWLGGGCVGYILLDLLRGIPGAELLPKGVDRLLTGHYGLGKVLTGLVRDLDYSHREVPDVRAWLTGAGLWLALAISLFAWAACRRPER